MFGSGYDMQIELGADGPKPLENYGPAPLSLTPVLSQAQLSKAGQSYPFLPGNESSLRGSPTSRHN